MSVSETAVQGKGRRQLLSIIALFLLPPIAAWLAWSYLGEQGVSATTNAGQLISPPRPLDLQGLRSAQGAVDGNDLVVGPITRHRSRKQRPGAARRASSIGASG